MSTLIPIAKPTQNNEQTIDTLITKVSIGRSSNPRTSKEGILSFDKVSVQCLEETIKGMVPMSKYFVVKLEKVKKHIFKSLHFLQKPVSNKNRSIALEKKSSEWKKRIDSVFNEKIITDGFWLTILYKNKEKFVSKEDTIKFKQIEESIMDRIAINYVEFMMAGDNPNSKDHELFFQVYFDIVSQGIFYSFFYAFPWSRQQFVRSFKVGIFNTFARLFTGLEISCKSTYIKGWRFVDDWYLNLGVGNVLDQSKSSPFP